MIAVSAELLDKHAYAVMRPMITGQAFDIDLVQSPGIRFELSLLDEDICGSTLFCFFKYRGTYQEGVLDTVRVVFGKLLPHMRQPPKCEDEDRALTRRILDLDGETTMVQWLTGSSTKTTDKFHRMAMLPPDDNDHQTPTIMTTPRFGNSSST
jgi:hypothetical protein